MMNSNEEKAFAVFVASIDKYLETLDEKSKDDFETWLEEHADDEELLAHLLQNHPQFGDIFTEAIEKSVEESV
jgi:succinate dehydrogenase flavin-adding protein (antitoxin of CptAB toxin-antitoxin module)